MVNITNFSVEDPNIKKRYHQRNSTLLKLQIPLLF
uniref:Uncharacterized protein n=1 Tax=Rhizophora mucronata TaxID=61149 RepID=A0A2P2NAF1_RHIMU